MICFIAVGSGDLPRRRVDFERRANRPAPSRRQQYAQTQILARSGRADGIVHNPVQGKFWQNQQQPTLPPENVQMVEQDEPDFYTKRSAAIRAGTPEPAGLLADLKLYPDRQGPVGRSPGGYTMSFRGTIIVGA